MKLDEFAFLNQPSAGMLKSGIRLETALRLIEQKPSRDAGVTLKNIRPLK